MSSRSTAAGEVVAVTTITGTGDADTDVGRGGGEAVGGELPILNEIEHPHSEMETTHAREAQRNGRGLLIIVLAACRTVLEHDSGGDPLTVYTVVQLTNGRLLYSLLPLPANGRTLEALVMATKPASPEVGLAAFVQEVIGVIDNGPGLTRHRPEEQQAESACLHEKSGRLTQDGILGGRLGTTVTKTQVRSERQKAVGQNWRKRVRC